MFALLFLITSGCATVSKGGEFKEARDSAFKIRVTLKLDLKPLNDFLAKKAAEDQERADQQKKDKEAQERREYCAKYPCFGHPWAIFRDDVQLKMSLAQESTQLEVTKVTRDFAEIGWSGTGWDAARANGHTYVMTAGHVCESKDVYHIDFFYIDWNTLEFEEVPLDLPIVEKHHVMIGRDGVDSADATIIRDEDLDEATFNGNDLCMLGVAGDLGTPIPVATHDPEYGESCSVVGAPTGLWGGGIAVPSDALFAGRGSVFGTEPDGLAFNGLLAPGNSGSAVVCDGRVSGVISLGSSRFPSLIHAVPQDRIRAFIGKALHLPVI
jgi:hypothetical protein